MSRYKNWINPDDQYDDQITFVAGEFSEVPRDKRWFFKYFRSECQRAFLAYYWKFHNYTRFSEHTGFAMSRRWKIILKKKILFLEESFEEAMKNGDIDAVVHIKEGKLKIPYWKLRARLDESNSTNECTTTLSKSPESKE